jgi:hypothetical protein
MHVDLPRARVDPLAPVQQAGVDHFPGPGPPFLRRTLPRPPSASPRRGAALGGRICRGPTQQTLWGYLGSAHEGPSDELGRQVDLEERSLAGCP